MHTLSREHRGELSPENTLFKTLVRHAGMRIPLAQALVFHTSRHVPSTQAGASRLASRRSPSTQAGAVQLASKRVP
eukprot:361758-Chlamydomonas_euryale.AAC.3